MTTINVFRHEGGYQAMVPGSDMRGYSAVSPRDAISDLLWTNRDHFGFTVTYTDLRDEMPLPAEIPPGTYIRAESRRMTLTPVDVVRLGGGQ